MAKLKIKMPVSVDYEEKWANKLPENEIVKIPAVKGGKEERETGR